MSGFRIEVSVKRDEKFNRIAEMLRSPRGLLLAIGARFMSYIDESFRSQGQHAGFNTSRWKPLAWLTVAMRPRGGSAPLQNTGAYRQSFVQSTDGESFVEAGTNKVPLAYWMEHGTSPYTIRPVRARVLAARLPSGPLGLIPTNRMSGMWFIFGKEVHHPGITARPVLPTKEIGEQLAQQVIDGYLEAQRASG